MASSSSSLALVAEQPHQNSDTVFPWLKGLPTAPEYHPTLAEFQDPISYIFKIENEASKYGICKIVPPVPPNPKKTAITNLNRSLAARAGTVYTTRSTNLPTFTTRQQQIGFCPRKPRPVQRPVWESGEYYTFQQFEAKAKSFEKSFLKKSVKKVLSPLEIETLYWKASVDKPFSVEYANDMPGSAFNVVNSKKCREAGEDAVTLGETPWNMRGVSRAKGSLLRCMKEEIPGVTSPMIYVAMMFSWFAWHVEDHDLHSLNYMHMGGGKTWYGVPREAAFAFEEVVRVHGYGGEINPLVTFATLGEKTTVMSPEVFINAGIPCCRLVQNPGEYVVTFPRAYHSGFSHGFNCGEAANIATPEWLRVAKDAAIRRASINYPPMVSHIQLLYDLALSSRLPMSVSAEPRSSRLKQKKKGEGEFTVRKLFAENVMRNNDLLHNLGEGSSIVILPQSCLYSSVSSSLHVGSQVKAQPKLYLGLSNQKETTKESRNLFSDGIMLDKNKGVKELKGYFSTEEKNASLCDKSRGSSFRGNSEKDSATEGVSLSGTQKRLFSCATCGTLSYACTVIVQPSEAAARYLMSANCSFFSDGTAGAGVSCEEVPVTKMNGISGKMGSKSDGLNDAPVQSSECEIQGLHQDNKAVSDTETHENPSSLGLLALNYGASSESDDDRVEQDKNFTLSPLSEDFDGSFSPTDNADRYEENRHQSSNYAYQVNRCNSPLESVEANLSECTFTDLLTNSNFSKPILPHENANISVTQRFQDDSSRMHVFCLEHAAEVEEKLRSIGGAHILLLCHPDYPSAETEAKLVIEELGIDHQWNDTTFRDATSEDEEWIQSALNSEEAVPGNGDWSVKMGINLYFSAILSRSPLYSKQMPYNSIIYNAFGCDSPSKAPLKPKVFFGKRPTRKKKILLAGKWCGKVWMTNQVHPLLVPKEPDEQGQVQVHERSLIGSSSKHDEQLQQNPETTLKPEIIQYYRKTGRKRKVGPDSRSASGSARKAKAKYFSRDSDDSAGDCPPQQEFRSIKKAKSRAFEEEEEEDPTSEREDLPSPEASPPLSTMFRNKRMKKEMPPRHQKKTEKNFTKVDPYSDDDLEGGPSTRLRKRKPKVEKDPEPKQVAKKPVSKRKMKKTLPAVKIKDEDVPRSRKIKVQELNYICDLEGCEMSFGSKHELVQHKRNICPVMDCGKRFFSHKYLVQHRRVHNDDRPLKCPWRGCKMAFKWSWARTEHIRVHTGARPYVCGDTGCGQTFRFVSDFSRHKRKTGHLTKKKTRG